MYLVSPHIYVRGVSTILEGTASADISIAEAAGVPILGLGNIGPGTQLATGTASNDSFPSTLDMLLLLFEHKQVIKDVTKHDFLVKNS